MRLRRDKEIYIKEQLRQRIPDGKFYLFGSRADDNTAGGDIDILILSNENIPKHSLRKFKVNFYKHFGWQKIDFTVFRFDEEHPFKELILHNAIEL